MGVVIHPTALLLGPVELGENVEIHAYAVIGDTAESRKPHSGRQAPLVIGDGTVIREHVVIQRDLEQDEPRVYVGDDCYLMHGVHVGHDAWIEDCATLSPLAVVGGHSRIMKATTMGIGSATHQYVTLGSVSMLGMGAMAVRDVEPGRVAVGVPAREIGMNTVGLERHNDISMVDEANRFTELSLRPR